MLFVERKVSILSDFNFVNRFEIISKKRIKIFESLLKKNFSEHFFSLTAKALVLVFLSCLRFQAVTFYFFKRQNAIKPVLLLILKLIIVFDCSKPYLLSKSLSKMPHPVLPHIAGYSSGYLGLVNQCKYSQMTLQCQKA